MYVRRNKRQILIFLKNLNVNFLLASLITCFVGTVDALSLQGLIFSLVLGNYFQVLGQCNDALRRNN